MNFASPMRGPGWSTSGPRPWSLLGAAALFIGVALTWLLPAVNRRPAAREPRPPSGPPWGQLSRAKFWQDPPPEITSATNCDTEIKTWKFRDYTPKKLEELFAAAGIDAPQRARLRAAATCTKDPEAVCVIRPDLATLNGMSSSARGIIYGALGSDFANAVQAGGFHMRTGDLESWLAQSGLRPTVQALFRSMLYRSGDFFYFADFPLLCPRLSRQDQQDLLRAVSRTPGLRLTLHVAEGDPVDELVRYWGAGGREESVRQALEPLSRRPGGGSIDVADLLPWFARSHLYTYDKPGANPRDCKWTALNFFNHGLDTVEVNDAHLEAALKNRYHPIDPSQARLGDLVVYQDEHYGFIHVATYIADDIVFVKNGIYLMWPWTLATLAFERDLYQYRAGVREIYYHADGLK